MAPTFKKLQTGQEKYGPTSKNYYKFGDEDYPGTTTDSFSEIFDLVKNLPNIWYHILPITIYDWTPWSAESYMKDGSIFCAVYLMTT